MSRVIRHKKLLRAIRTLEKACLSRDSKPTTAADIHENGYLETKDYWHWLRRQAPNTATFVVGTDDFDTLWHS